jgi:hypothetical protein
VDGRLGPERILAGGYGVKLAQDRDRWRAVVNTVMNLRVQAPWS